MSRLRDESGFTLAEMLVGAMLMIIVMSATLMLLDQMTLLSKRTDRRVDTQDAARNASRQLARSLRNLAGSPESPALVERAGQFDLVFRTVDRPRTDAGANVRNLKRVRYCLDAREPQRAKIFEQTQRWSDTVAPPMPTGTGCPASGWDGTARVVADHVTNRANGTSRSLWRYGQTAAGQITSVKLNLFMSSNPSGDAREVGLTTGVYLRNQNRAPEASFTATEVGVGHVLLNGSGSFDADGQGLDFHWYADGAEVGRGLLFDYYGAPGQHTLWLEVFDPSGLSSRAPSQTVVLG